MTEGFSIMPSTCKILLSEWGISDFQRGTPGIGDLCAWSPRPSSWYVVLWKRSKDAQYLSVDRSTAAVKIWLLQRKDTPLFDICLIYQLNQCRLAQRTCDMVIK